MKQTVSPPPSAANLKKAQGTYKIPALRILSEISSSLSSDSTLEELLRRFLGTLTKLAGADAGAVRVLTTDGKRLRLVGAVGLPPDVIDRERYIDLECGVCGKAAQASQAQSVHYSQDLKICTERSSLHYFGNQCKRVVAVPLRYKGKLLGVYNLFLAHDQAVPEEVALLFHSISEHLGMALENARLTRENIRITLMNERQMLANEIHDSMAQTLAYMKMRMSLLRDAMHNGNESKTEKYLEEANQALNSAYTELRSLITNFRNRMDPRGLLPALQEMVDSCQERTHIDIDFQNHTPDLNLTPDQEVQVFHIIQEALSNIVKHASARHVQVSIALQGDCYAVTVEDDGIGLADRVPSPDSDMHFGLYIMRERAQRISGSIMIDNLENNGTRVKLTFPVMSAAARETR
ncbi:MAG TPA: histidine kinase [Betaproteobacteria bacterium]|nr:histidine kinase [Betaproteobacteria bacterium]